MNKIAQHMSGLVAAGIILLSATTATYAQQVCAPRGDVLSQLQNRHAERVLGRGLAPGGKAMLELFVSKSGAWTVLVSHPNGRSCFIASGDSWHEIEPTSAGSI